MKSGIYKISNTVTGRIYIGSSVNISNRKYNHLWKLETGQHDNSFLQKSFNKHGVSAFDFEVVEMCEVDKLIEREQYYLDKFQSYKRSVGYNICEKAYSTQGVKCSDKTKAKISAKNKGSKRNCWRDKSIHCFVNRQGIQERMTAYDFCNKYKVNSSHLGKLIKGELASTKGWFIDEVKGRTSYNKLSIDGSKLKEDYENYMSLPKISDKYKISTGSAKKYIIEAGGSMRSMSESQYAAKNLAAYRPTSKYEGSEACGVPNSSSDRKKRGTMKQEINKLSNKIVQKCTPF